MIPATFDEAVAWLDKYAVPDMPTRIHDHAVGDDGAPRLAADFWNWLIRGEADRPWAFQVVQLTVDEPCPRQHPIRKKGEARCELCDDALGWRKTRAQYVRPFMAALERLRNEPATSPLWPTPREMVVALIRAQGDVIEAASAIGISVLDADHKKTVEAAFLHATRRLIQKWSSGPIDRPRRISDAQAQAEAA